MKKYESSSFLGSGYKRLDLKYLFDHFRNIGIAAVIMASGNVLSTKYSEHFISIFKYGPGLVTDLLILIGVLLLVANFIQLLYVSSSCDSWVGKSLLTLLILPAYIVTICLAASFVFSQSNA